MRIQSANALAVVAMVLLVGMASPTIARKAKPACAEGNAAVAVATKPGGGSPIPLLGTSATGTYALDPDHSNVLWKIGHLGLSRFIARFDRISGSLLFAPDAPETSKLNVVIAADSISSKLPMFDKKLTGKSFLNAEECPDITFVSDSVLPTGPNTGRATGMLTLACKARPATLDIVYNGAEINPANGKFTLGFSAKGVINRRDWGITAFSGLVADLVELEVEVEFLRSTDTPAPEATRTAPPTAPTP